MLDEWSTLVNPQRDLGPSHVHGITAGDVLDAPTFGEVVGDLFERMRGAVLVAHNLRFDHEFLTAEVGRCGGQLPALPALCTLVLDAQLDPDAGSRKLAACCARIGYAIPHAHAALDDARAAAALLTAHLSVAAGAGATTLAQIGCEPLAWPTMWPAVEPSNRRHARGGRAVGTGAQAGYLSQLVACPRGVGSSDPNIAAYLDVLDRALEDRRITSIEAEVLLETAARWGLNRTQVAAAHRSYLEALADAAMADGVLTDLERNDLELVSRLLGTAPPGADGPSGPPVL